MLTLYTHAVKGKLAQQITRTGLYSTTRSLSTTSIPDMPIVKAVAEQGKALVNFKKTAFFGVQHILRTSIPLFNHLIHTLGAKPNYIFLSGKGYSDSEEAEDALNKLGIQYFKLSPSYTIPGRYQQTIRAHLKKNWDTFTQTIKRESIEKVIVFDEGGHCFETMPESLCFKYPMAGVEQTRGGLYSPAIEVLPFPLVEVASSAAKQHLESPFIIASLISKLEKVLAKNNQELNSDTIFGVLGNGSIGYHLTQYLLANNYNVIAFDKNQSSFIGTEWRKPNFYRAKSAKEVLVRSSYIFGCTGENVIETPDLFDNIATDKTLISCTSEDKEFQTLLYKIGKSLDENSSTLIEAGEDISYVTKAGGKITLLNGGFPINFDHSGDSVPSQKIQLTRALMLGALIQGAQRAAQIKGQGKINQPPRIMLDPALQHYVAHQLKSYQDKHPELAEKWSLFENLRSIEEKSGGLRVTDTQLMTIFSDKRRQNGPHR